MTEQNQQGKGDSLGYAYEVGVISARLNEVRTNLHMGESKEALHNVNNLIAFIEEAIVPRFYIEKLQGE